MPVKKITIKNVVNAGDVVRSLEDGKREMALPCQRPDFRSVRGIVEIYGEEVKALGCPTRVQPVECFQVLLASQRLRDPEIQQHCLAAKRMPGCVPDRSSQEEKNPAQPRARAARFQSWQAADQTPAAESCGRARLQPCRLEPQMTRALAPEGSALKASMRDGSTPSSTHTLWLSGRSRSSCTNPLGQRIDARTGPLASPSPKNTSLLCWERNPDPACKHARLPPRLQFPP